MNAIRTLVFAAVVLPYAALPAIAHNEDRGPPAGVRAVANEYSQETSGVPARPRPDTSIPEKIAPAHSLGNERYHKGIGSDGN